MWRRTLHSEVSVKPDHQHDVVSNSWGEFIKSGQIQTYFIDSVGPPVYFHL
jgi:hypothetical protein